jgi:protein dithiol oxidoreductase (disulfide-forming)
MKRIAAVIFAISALLPLGAAAQQKYAYSEIKPAVPVETEGKIEVVEFFWYGCIHCYNLEPAVEKWEKTLPKDVQFRRIPAVFNDRWAIDASIFYTLEAMGLLEKLHRPLFDAIHQSRLRTDSQKEFLAWLEKQGVDPKKFTETMKSFGVQSKMRRAAQLTALYKIDGTPAMAVNGRYTVSTEQGRTQAGMFETVNYLADTIRKQK